MTGGVTSYGYTVNELQAAQTHCAYPSKVCTNPRALKLCGSLHKLCEFHRKKANLNQKRLQQRRRVMRAQTTAATQPRTQPEQQHDCGDGRHERQHTTSYSNEYASSPTAVDASSLSLVLSRADGGFRSEHHPSHDHYGYAIQHDELTVQDAQLLQSILFDEPNFSAFGFTSAGDTAVTNSDDAVGEEKRTADVQSFGSDAVEYEFCL